jgi:hypothetical protein
LVDYSKYIKVVSKPGFILLFVSLLAIICLVFLIFGKSENPSLPITTKEEAAQIAIEFLERRDILVDPETASVVFLSGKWNVLFPVNSPPRIIIFPGAILVRINSITGTAKIIPGLR